MSRFIHVSILVVLANLFLVVTPGVGFVAFLHRNGAWMLHLLVSASMATSFNVLFRLREPGRLLRYSLPVFAAAFSVAIPFAVLTKGVYFSGVPSLAVLTAFLWKAPLLGLMLGAACWLPVGIVGAVLYARYSRLSSLSAIQK